jgi:four helix bundle protein
VIAYVIVNATLIVVDNLARHRILAATAEPSGRYRAPATMLAFQRLDVYRCAIELVAFARLLVQSIPKGHADLVDQLRRAAQSIPQNIAEGAGKTTRADKARYYAIARGSAMESVAHLDVMRVHELIDEEQHARGNALLERVVAMLTRMIDP